MSELDLDKVVEAYMDASASEDMREWTERCAQRTLQVASVKNYSPIDICEVIDELSTSSGQEENVGSLSYATDQVIQAAIQSDTSLIEVLELVRVLYQSSAQDETSATLSTAVHTVSYHAFQAKVSLTDSSELGRHYSGLTDVDENVGTTAQAIIDTVWIIGGRGVVSDAKEISQALYDAGSQDDSLGTISTATNSVLYSMYDKKIPTPDVLKIIDAYSSASDVDETVGTLAQVTCDTIDYMAGTGINGETIAMRINGLPIKPAEDYPTTIGGQPGFLARLVKAALTDTPTYSAGELCDMLINS